MGKRTGKHATIEGVVEYLNLSSKGSYDALLLKTEDKRVQINFAPELSEQLAKSLHDGDRVTAEVDNYEDDRRGQHRVYSLVSLAGPNGLQIGNISGAPIKGKVERINFAKHGEPNGAVLDSGYFVHLRPSGARAIDLKLGQMLEVQGRVKAAVRGPYQVIEADVVNAVDLSGGKHPQQKPTNAAAPKATAKKTSGLKVPAKKKRRLAGA